MVTGPCGWVPTFAHFCTAATTEWATYPAPTQATAVLLASTRLWASLGRRHHACDVIARPVLRETRISEMDLVAAPDAYVTYVDSGNWLTPSAGDTSDIIDATRCRLDGPVASVTSVTINGAVVLANKYRVDDGWWLVRIDGLSWPMWQDLSLPSGANGTFVVNYKQGVAPSAVILAMAGTLALEYARAICGNTACRLPSRTRQIVRAEVTVDMVDPTVFAEAGLTGVEEVDALISALNPRHQIAPSRVLVPGMTAPKVSV